MANSFTDAAPLSSQERDADNVDFHFYHELRKDKYYEPLIPVKQTGLILVLLYEEWKSGRYPGNNFPEEAVRNAIEQVALDFGKTYFRTPHERFKDANLKLQQYFLLRNEDTNCYHITQYGIDFCERVKAKLLLEFNPSIIEKILADLIESLKRYATNDFEYWYNHLFYPQQSTIKNQAETLLRQVDESVREFRTATKSNDATFLETLRKVDKSLEIIGKHSEELKGAFYDAEDIKALLTQMSFGEMTWQTILYRENVRAFLESVSNDLSIISQRIERIRPKLRQFISSINQRNFDRNTELFLRHILKNASLKKDGNKKKIQLPGGIEKKIVTRPQTNFTIVEPDRIKYRQPTPIVLPKEDLQKRKERLDIAQDRLLIRDKVRNWMSLLEGEIHTNGQIEFSAWYFKILDQETQYATTIAIRVASGIFAKYTKVKNYTVTVEKTFAKDEKHPNHTLWNMNIQTA